MVIQQDQERRMNKWKEAQLQKKKKKKEKSSKSASSSPKPPLEIRSATILKPNELVNTGN